MASDSLFYSLPSNIQNKIDVAFDAVARPAKSVDNEPIAGGGFISEPGGFLLDDDGSRKDYATEFQVDGFIRGKSTPSARDEDARVETSHIPLSLIPSALQNLDLPPDDEEVLAVFRNAATGWTSSDNERGHQAAEEDVVAKEDWRSVCTVLFEHMIDKTATMDQDIIMPGMGVEESDADTDEYRDSDIDREEDYYNEEDEEYMEGPSTSVPKRRLRGKATASPLPPTVSNTKSDKLTSRQRQVCIEAFTLLFPSVPSEALLNQRIMLKDIQRIAKLLNEKLKVEEMLEMLETFTSSPDKSMDFSDFCRMMLKSKLA